VDSNENQIQPDFLFENALNYANVRNLKKGDS
jgi:hypothetical protein